MHKYILLAITLFFSLNCSTQELKLQQTTANWLEDIEFLQEKIENTVPDFDNRVDGNAVSQAFDRLKEDLSSLEARSIYWEIQQILGLIGDEGCNALPFQQGLSFPILPLKTYWFKDGLFVLDAHNDYKNLMGEQIISINDHTVKEVYNRISTSLNADNEHYKKYIFQAYVNFPGLLKAYGLGQSENTISLSFASGAKMVVNANNVSEYGKLERYLPNDEYFLPTKNAHENENYWSEYIPGSSTLFVQLKRIANDDKADSFASFVSTLEGAITSGKVQKLIIDVRYGGGGNGFKLKRLTDLLRDSKAINKKGHLFVLTSRATRGTLLELTSILMLNTKAIVVGKPTGEGPNTVSDTKYIKLPNSGLSISLPKIFWPTSWAGDKRNTIQPDILIEYSFEQYQKKLDPWVAACLNYSGQKENQAVPKETRKKLLGSYKIEGKKVSIIEEGDRLFFIRKRAMKSFFEIKTELHYSSEGVLSADINNVFLYHNNNQGPVQLSWKGVELSIN